MTTKALEYSTDLQEFAVSAAEYLRQHPEYDVLVTGVAVFNRDGKLLLVQRAADEMAFPDMWEIPGGKVDDTDETILHGAVRELKEEAGLEATRVVRKVAQFTFEDERPGRPKVTWAKFIFEMEADDVDSIVLDPVEHQDFVFASEEEVANEQVGEVKLQYVAGENKKVKLEAFRAKRAALSC